MVIAALFTIAKLWKKPKCPLLMKGLRKCGIYTQWNFIQPQRRKILSFAGKWMELGNTILSEVARFICQKPMFSLMCGI
jgi:hypothetical protein